MAEISVTEARARLAEIVDKTRRDREPTYLTRRGTRVAAVIDAEVLDHLIEAAEDLADIRAAKEAKEEMTRTGQTPIPWEEVKADLGLT